METDGPLEGPLSLPMALCRYAHYFMPVDSTVYYRVYSVDHAGRALQLSVIIRTQLKGTLL